MAPRHRSRLCGPPRGTPRSSRQRPGSSAAQVYPFNDGTIYQVYTAPGLVTDIRLQPGETLVAVASGDTARWVIGDTTSGGSGSGSGDGKQTHVLVKPVSAGGAGQLPAA
ncbi:TrbG/VirB9 family P-type conjugative transfer protein [Sphingomonas fuzhouensis]|uniref:TrbG/VirB9 family P-type conjugative transfer protein n=1 Tax=Sphingomonas fuzhouensis TaxID=3106033 RepID=UPI002B002DA3|nr:TrbG/VirB9 family P-type conjugative transfer protein [Sphingomonas sp. SGZ-02]